LKVAIVHYWFITRRGGEKVVESLLKLYPQADVYTLFYDPNQYGDYISKHKVFTSILDSPIFRKYYQKLFPLYPLAIQSLKLKDDYDLIISSESGPAKGIQIKNNATHISYIHSPMRYAWSHTEMYVDSVSWFLRPTLRFFLKRLKKWDKKTINNVDLYISNSSNVAARVKKFYGKPSQVIYPPIEEKLFSKPLRNRSKEFYLSFGALTPYKKIDLLIDTFNKNGKIIVIIGEGSEKEKLQKNANSNIQFKSCEKWDEIEYYLLKTKALLFPGEEDFGMVPLEVMSYGIPVLAYAKGGALETVVENKMKIENSSGLFFKEQTVESVEKTIQYFESVEDQFDDFWILNHAKGFKESSFIEKFKLAVLTQLRNKGSIE